MIAKAILERDQVMTVLVKELSRSPDMAMKYS